MIIPTPFCMVGVKMKNVARLQRPDSRLLHQPSVYQIIFSAQAFPLAFLLSAHQI